MTLSKKRLTAVRRILTAVLKSLSVTEDDLCYNDINITYEKSTFVVRPYQKIPCEIETRFTQPPISLLISGGLLPARSFCAT